MTRIVDLKKGDKFYMNDWEDEGVYELLDVVRIHENEDTFEYKARRLVTNEIVIINTTGMNATNHSTVLKFKGRDKGSFLAGFKAAMRLYQKYMQIFDKENAGLDSSLNIHLTMMEEYNKWKKNR